MILTKVVRYLALVLTLFVAASAPAVVWRNDITDAQVLTFGNDPRFVGVGQVDTLLGFGTGTYIGHGNGAGWILSANHVITAGEAGTFRLPGYGTFDISETFRIPDTNISVSRLVNFEVSIFAPALISTGVSLGTDFVSAGFGGSRPESGGTLEFDGQRRGFQSRTAGFYTETDPSETTFPGQYVIDVFNSPASADIQPLEGFGAPGDSGSMMLTSTGIAGVLSYGSGDIRYGSQSAYSQLTPEISSEIYNRTGIGAVPEPATLAALGLGAVAMLRRRQKA